MKLLFAPATLLIALGTTNVGAFTVRQAHSPVGTRNAPTTAIAVSSLDSDQALANELANRVAKLTKTEDEASQSTKKNSFIGEAVDTIAPNGEYKIEVSSNCKFNYGYTFLDEVEKGGALSLENTYLADYFKDYGRACIVIDGHVNTIYGDKLKEYFAHHKLGTEIHVVGIDEDQKSLKTVEECMVFFADVGLMRREKPLVIGGGLITDIIGTACALYRRSTSFVRLPTTLIGLIDASIAIKVGGNLVGKHKNRIGAFHPPSGVIMDFNFLETLPEQHVRNGLAELIKISAVQEESVFKLLEENVENLLKFKFGYIKVAEDGEECPEGLREIGKTILRKSVKKMLDLECTNLHEHDQNRAIAYGHTWSPCFELAQSPPMHHGHAIAADMCFSLTWAENLGIIDSSVKERVFNVFRKAGLSLMHPWFDEASLLYGTDTIMARRDGDLYAALPDGEIGAVRYAMIADFQEDGDSRDVGRKKLDESLKQALIDHRNYVANVDGDENGYGNGVGKTPYITLGLNRNTEKTNKLELGTWSERLTELHTEVQESQSFEAVNEKIAGIKRWWDMCGDYMDDHSSSLGEAALNILEKQEEPGVFPEGMSDDWALDMQSAKTLNFLAALKASSSDQADKTAWDLGTLTGISAAVLGSHFDEVVSVERNEQLATFAKKHLQDNVSVKCTEIDTWLTEQAAAGNQADMIFMDLDKTAYEPLYKMIMEKNLLKPNGLLIADNVLYRGLPAEVAAGEDLEAKYASKDIISEKTKLNAQALAQFNNMIKDDVAAGKVRSLMMPVRDGMMGVMRI